MVEDSKKAGLMQVLRAQATQLLGEVEAMTGSDLLSKDQKAMLPIDQALQDLQAYQIAENMQGPEFAAAHKRMQEIKPQVKAVYESMDAEQKKKYEKKAEKKVLAQTLKHREKLQKQFNEAAESMPDVQKMRLNETMKRMPLAKQEQFIAELVATHQRRVAMSDSEKQAEDAEMAALAQNWTALMNSLDPMQQQILQSNLGNMMPSDQVAFMKKTISGGLQDIIPPSQEEVKDWKGCYLSYWNAEFSVKQGRILPLKFCVKNPRPDEVMEAFRSLKIRAIFETTKQRPSDCFHLGRFKFQLVDSLGNFVNDKYQSKRQVLQSVGKYINSSPVRTDPITCAEKEKEGVFNFDEEMERIEQAMQQVHGPTAGQAEQQAKAAVKADKKKNKKKR